MDTVLALTSAFRDSAPINPSLGYTPNNVLPSNAQQVTAPDGTVFNAPPNADFAAVYTYGTSLASIPSPLNTGGLQYASGFGGLFDFQRGNNQFNGNYAYASNYAIGILANGANVSLGYVQFAAGLVKFLSGGHGFPKCLGCARTRLFSSSKRSVPTSMKNLAGWRVVRYGLAVCVVICLLAATWIYTHPLERCDRWERPYRATNKALLCS